MHFEQRLGSDPNSECAIELYKKVKLRKYDQSTYRKRKT